MALSMRLEGRVAVVTGAARGIGAAVACAMAREGARVVLADRDRAGVHAVKENLTAGLPRFEGIAVETDVTSSDSVEAMAIACTETYGRMDVMVNAAGVISCRPVVDMPEEEFDRVIAVNLRGTFLCSRAAARIMVRERSGSIINLSSGSGKRGAPTLSHYCASKFAVIGFSQALALEVAAHQVRVNCICPGLVDTQMMRSFIEETSTAFQKSADEWWVEWETRVPLGRMASPEEVADVAVFLASDESAYITAQAINVCGGLILH